MERTGSFVSQGDPETSIGNEVAASTVKTTCRSELIRYQFKYQVPAFGVVLLVPS
jgi:hypothetical protein